MKANISEKTNDIKDLKTASQALDGGSIPLTRSNQIKRLSGGFLLRY
jgi:hypothetical protein